MTATNHTLDRLFAVIAARKGADPDSSYTAKLFAQGAPRIAQKLGEDRTAVTAESADLLYHLLVLWAERGVAPDDVWAELARREGVSGLVEKAARKPD